MDRHDVRMRETGCRARLAQEALARRVVGRQNHEDDVAIELNNPAHDLDRTSDWPPRVKQSNE